MTRPRSPCRRPASPMSPAPVATERCAEERRLADERCELATRARAQADAAADALRARPAHLRRARGGRPRRGLAGRSARDPCGQGGGPGRVPGRRRARPIPDELEAAARDWLTEINRINNEARDATAIATQRARGRGGDRGDARAPEPRGRRGADRRRQRRCRLPRRPRGRRRVRRAGERRIPCHLPRSRPATTSVRVPRLDEDETLGLALEAGGAPRIFRLLRGDRAAMTTLVASLAGDDPDARRRWQLLLTGLVEAIVADAIEASAPRVPRRPPVLGTVHAGRRTATSPTPSSSLGYRFDGLGGWTDDRVPVAARPVARARLRRARPDARPELAERGGRPPSLFRDVTVAADEYLAGHRRRPDPRRDGDDARPAGGRPGRALEPVGPVRPLLLEEA